MTRVEVLDENYNFLQYAYFPRIPIQHDVVEVNAKIYWVTRVILSNNDETAKIVVFKCDSEKEREFSKAIVS